MLGLELKPNGGAALEAIARQGNPDAFAFGVPMKKYGNCDFSYAGLKTSVRLCIEKHLGSAEGVGKRASVTMQQQQQQQHAAAAAAATASNGGGSAEAVAAPSSSSSSSDSAADDQQQQQMKADIAASFQKVAVQHLMMRLKRAITWAREECPEVQHLVVAGGVASNQYVRQQVSQVRAMLRKRPPQTNVWLVFAVWVITWL
jgi:N6-L-threonylcarbamoyladenine synthase